MQRRYFKTKKGGAELFEIISSKKKKRTISFRREGGGAFYKFNCLRVSLKNVHHMGGLEFNHCFSHKQSDQLLLLKAGNQF